MSKNFNSRTPKPGGEVEDQFELQGQGRLLCPFTFLSYFFFLPKLFFFP